MLASALPGSFCPSSSLSHFSLFFLLLWPHWPFIKSWTHLEFLAWRLVCPLDALFLPGHFLSLLKNPLCVAFHLSGLSLCYFLRVDFAQPPSPKIAVLLLPWICFSPSQHPVHFFHRITIYLCICLFLGLSPWRLYWRIKWFLFSHMKRSNEWISE